MLEIILDLYGGILENSANYFKALKLASCLHCSHMISYDVERLSNDHRHNVKGKFEDCRLLVDSLELEDTRTTEGTSADDRIFPLATAPSSSSTLNAPYRYPNISELESNLLTMLDNELDIIVSKKAVVTLSVEILGRSLAGNDTITSDA